MKTKITERVLACLNATNEAISRSDYRDEALQGAYSAALKRGGSSAQQFCWRIPINSYPSSPLATASR
jgi:hypothetical protein